MDKSLIREVIRKIQDNLESWDQALYASECGTRYCFAGWALRLSGFGYVDGRWLPPLDMPHEALPESAWRFAGVGEVLPFQAARHLLGLDEVQASAVFYWTPQAVSQQEQFAELVELVERVTGSKIN